MIERILQRQSSQCRYHPSLLCPHLSLLGDACLLGGQQTLRHSRLLRAERRPKAARQPSIPA